MYFFLKKIKKSKASYLEILLPFSVCIEGGGTFKHTILKASHSFACEAEKCGSGKSQYYNYPHLCEEQAT